MAAYPYTEDPIYPPSLLLDLHNKAETMDGVINDFDNESRQEDEKTNMGELVPHLDKARNELNETIKGVIYEAFMTGFRVWHEQEPEERTDFPYEDWEKIIKPSARLLSEMARENPKTQKGDWQENALLWASNALWKMDDWQPSKEWDTGTIIALSCLNRNERNELLKKGQGEIKAEDFLQQAVLPHANVVCKRVHHIAAQMQKAGNPAPPYHTLHPELWTKEAAINTYNSSKFHFDGKKKLDGFLSGIEFFIEWAGGVAPLMTDFYYGLHSAISKDYEQRPNLKKEDITFLKEAQETLLKLATEGEKKSNHRKPKI